ncbi:alpha/beta hydrolase [Halobacillus litoralis]|uniref:alpha/beta hydrolase n=1 Tax=Halobacillus litoralis TaxID=45668 RepID=UPI001CD819EE|nr:alpha/beta hydrolase [Halobacillus litoralis]MCA0968976.1 alpha/beta hydrolase [Halobacillus litoralis]
MTKETWKTYRGRDFSKLQYAYYEHKKGKQRTALIMIHGITAELEHHKKLSSALQMDADVFLPVLRGYDRLNKRGDLDYFGQYDDDLLDFIHYIQKQGYDTVILAGHSMGCANILRLIHHQPQAADYYLFLSPFFHPTLPVYRDDATDQFKPETDVDYTVYSKKAMLLMTLHKFNLSQFSHKTVAEIPDEFEGHGKLSLSFRLLASRFLEKLPENPFEGMESRVMTILGDQDEVIRPEAFLQWYEEAFHQKALLIQNTDHNHILHDEEMHQEIAGWLSD